MNEFSILSSLFTIPHSHSVFAQLPIARPSPYSYLLFEFPFRLNNVFRFTLIASAVCWSPIGLNFIRSFFPSLTVSVCKFLFKAQLLNLESQLRCIIRYRNPTASSTWVATPSIFSCITKRYHLEWSRSRYLSAKREANTMWTKDLPRIGKYSH